MLLYTLLLLASSLGHFVQALGTHSNLPKFLHKAPRGGSVTRAAKLHKENPRFLNLGATLTTSAATQSTESTYYAEKTTSTRISLKKQLYSFFQECHDGITEHVRRITDICQGFTATENEQNIAWELLAELQAILALCVACFGQVKGCRESSAPSGIPAGKGTTPSLSTQQIAEIIYGIMCQLKTCFYQMNIVCSRSDIIRNTCSDCLVQISSSSSQFLSASGVHLSGLLSSVTSLVGGNVEAFFNLRAFGLDSIFEVFNS